jgi:hypothetical protein
VEGAPRGLAEVLVDRVADEFVVEGEAGRTIDECA